MLNIIDRLILRYQSCERVYGLWLRVWSFRDQHILFLIKEILQSLTRVTLTIQMGEKRGCCKEITIFVL